MNSSVPVWILRALATRALSPQEVRALAARIREESLQGKDLYLLLFENHGGANEPDVRAAIVHRIGRQLNLAPTILASYCLKHGLRQPVPEVGYGSPGPLPFRYRCVIDLHGTTVTGDWADGWSKKEAMQRSQLRLLEQLADAVRPVARQHSPAGPPVPTADLVSLDEKQFLERLKREPLDSRPPQDLLEHAALRARSGLLRLEDAEYLLFTLGTDNWAAAKREALAAAVRVTGRLPDLLHLYQARTGIPQPRWEVGETRDAEGYFTAEAETRAGRKAVSSGPQRARNKQDARNYARAALLAKLLGVPEPFLDRGSQLLFVVASASSALNAAEMQRRINGLDGAPDDPGRPPYSCRVSCEVGGQKLTAAAQGPSKKAAKETACRQLLLRVNIHLDRQPMPETAEPPRQRRPTRPAPEAVPVPEPAALPSPAPLRPRDDFRLRAAEPAMPIDVVLTALERGAELTFDVDNPPLTAELLCFGPALGDALRPHGKAVVNRWIVQAGGEAEYVQCGRARIADLLAVLVSADHSNWSASARLCAAIARLALEIIQNGFVLPGYAEGTRSRDRQPAWVLGPIVPMRMTQIASLAERLDGVARCLRELDGPAGGLEVLPGYEVVRTFLDTAADRFVRQEAAYLAFGAVPFAAPVTLTTENPPLQRWAEEQRPDDDTVALPSIVLKIEEPDPSNGHLHAVLQFRAIPGSSDSAVDAISVWRGEARPPIDDADLRRQVCTRLRRAALDAP
ncbi:double-stranded RNA binding motif domain-containing protein, partial [Amycolatopsis sp. NPDC000746]